MLRRLLRPVSYALVALTRPIKIFAYRTRWRGLGRVLLAITKPLDFILIFVNTQNEVMLIYQRVYGGNFLFGDGVMITDFATTDAEIRRPSERYNDFMGVNIVSSKSDVFASNSGILNQNEPLRTLTRGYLDEHVFTPSHHALTLAAVREQCQQILHEWSADPEMAKMMSIRSVATRIFLRVLSGKTVTAEDATVVTHAYVRRFVELSLFGRYFQILAESLGSRKFIRKDAYFRLKALGIDTMVIDVTLFAAMFSVGTLVIQIVEDLRREDIDYPHLDETRRRRLVIEAVRLFPTVTSVHRVLEHDSTVRVAGQDLHLTAGDQLVYPFVCSNRDPQHFPDPERFSLERSDEEYDKVLSWSKGAHACPGKEISILVTLLMLDALAARFDLRKLKIVNPAF